MRAAVGGADSGSYSTQLPVTLVDKQSMAGNPTIGLLEKGTP
jgi:hypothetical protein